MAGQNDFLIFDQSGDNMLTQQNYASDTDRASGYRTGLARSIVMNKVLHQTSMLAHALGEIAKDNNQVATDTGSVADLKTALSNALMGANIDLSNLSYTGENKFVKKTGDTMTGRLDLKHNDGTALSLVKTNDYSTQTTSGSTNWDILFQDYTQLRRATVRAGINWDANGQLTRTNLTLGTNGLDASAPQGIQITTTSGGTSVFLSSGINLPDSASGAQVVTASWVRTRISNSVTYNSSTRTITIG